MGVDDATRRLLNLVAQDPRFVCRSVDDIRWTIEQPDQITHDTGIYLLAGETLPHAADPVPSAFLIDSVNGGVREAYWRTTSGVWVDSQEVDALAMLGLTTAQMFPYDWRTAVPVVRDIHHDAGEPPRPGRLP